MPRRRSQQLMAHRVADKDAGIRRPQHRPRHQEVCERHREAQDTRRERNAGNVLNKHCSLAVNLGRHHCHDRRGVERIMHHHRIAAAHCARQCRYPSHTRYGHRQAVTFFHQLDAGNRHRIHFSLGRKVGIACSPGRYRCRYPRSGGKDTRRRVLCRRHAPRRSGLPSKFARARPSNPLQRSVISRRFGNSHPYRPSRYRNGAARAAMR